MSAQTPTANRPDMPIEEFKTIEEAIDCMKKYQHILGLDDWIIKLHFAEPHEFTTEECAGECEYNVVKKGAVIRLLKPQYYGERITKNCAEATLVHELLHCKFAHLDTNDEFHDRLLHQMIDDLAKAIVCARSGVNLKWYEAED